MITITRRLEFDAGHRVLHHESKCRTPHGHRYVVEVTARADALDSLGRVIDFSVLKGRIGTWLDEQWDHCFILFNQDTELIDALSKVSSAKSHYISDWNPTAENMAIFLLKKSADLLYGTGVEVTKVVVHETPNCKAEACL